MRRPIALLALAAAVATVPAGGDAAIVIGNDAPAWSPDGRAIAFTSFRHGNGEIYVMAGDGSTQRRLTQVAAHDDHAAWSPDGSLIAFASTRDGNYEIYAMRTDGSEQRRLTDHPQSDFEPTWSPDGTRIAWRTNRDGNAEIYSMRADGTDVRRLTEDAASDESPDWSRAGIAFSSNRSGGAFNVHVMDADGGNVRRVTSGRTNKHEPAWSPDATRLLYVSDADLPLGNTEIYVIDADGSNERRLTNYDGRDDWPAWAPNGAKIVFSRGITYRAPDIFVANPDGSAPTKLTATAARLEVTRVFAADPRPGRTWTLRVLVEDARGLPIDGARPICRAAVAGHAAKLVGASTTAGVVRCAWRIPRGTVGKQVRGRIGLRVGTLEIQVPFALPVRRGS